MGEINVQIRQRLKAQQSINERDDLIAERLNIIRNMLLEEKNLRCPMEDAFLLRYLRARKYNLERAFKLIKQFFEMKRKLAFLTIDLVPSTFVDIYEAKFLTALKSPDSQGRTIILLRTDNWDPTCYCLDDILRSCFLFLDELVASVETQLFGVSLVMDFTGFGLKHARQFGPVRVQQLVQLLQDSYPVRFKEFHCINHPFIFNMIYSIIKPFLKEKMRKRFTFHGHDVSSLHKFISPDILPIRLGGKLQEHELSDPTLIKRLLDNEEYYKEFLEYGYLS